MIEPTDHHALIPNVSGATERLVRWRFPLSQFDFEVVYYAAILNQAADALSRLITGNAEETSLDDDVSTMLIAHHAELDAACACP